VIGRAHETAALRAALDGAQDGNGRVVLLEGPAGIGKSELCLHARALARERQLSVLAARGGELEHDLTYGIVRQLLERIVHDASQAERKRLLAGPARLATAALGGELTELSYSADTGIDHGLYWLTCNLATPSPMVLIVDDLHWSDVASLRFLMYLARRLDGLAVSLVLAARPREDGFAARVTGLLRAEATTEVISLGPLTLQESTELLSARVGVPVAGEIARACHEVAGGNPFLLSEVAGALRELQQAAGHATDGFDAAVTIEHIRSLLPRSATNSVLLRLGSVSGPAQAIAGALAALGDGTPVPLLREVAEVDEQAAYDALAQLATAGIVTRAGRLGFVHPLVRTAVYDDMTEVRRQLLHARAAKALSDQAAPPEEIAHHLVLAVPAGDQTAVEVLRSVAARALARGAAETSVRLLRRALVEPPAPAHRAAVLAELGAAELRAASAADADEHLSEALALHPEPAIRVQAAIGLANAKMAVQGPPAAFSVLAAEAAKLSGDDALRLDVERALLAQWVRGFVPMADLEQLLARFAELPGDTPAERLALSQAALAAAYDDSRTASRAAELAVRALAGGKLVAEQTVDGIAPGMLCYTLTMAEEFDIVEAEVERLFADAQDRGSTLGYFASAVIAGQVALRRGRLTEAAAQFEAALNAGRQLEESPVVHRSTAFSTAWLIEALVARGAFDAAQAVASNTESRGEFDRPEYVWSLYGRGILRLLVDLDPQAALGDFERVGAAAQAGGYEDRSMPWRGWMSLALHAAGRADEAIGLADDHLRIAARWAPGLHGSALRVRALVGDPADAIAMLSDAVETLRASQFQFELAQALVDHGVALRRETQRLAARSVLEEGMELAARCEATPLLERARQELIVLGARPQRLMFSGIEGLTATERRVASLAADGRTNRAIAQALFVTQKTVEAHLRSVYRKLDISSRQELPETLMEAS
jgi:DNA-binding CsgD family transcriptional regulator/tetratricopeptide (TPR) repeat protein